MLSTLRQASSVLACLSTNSQSTDMVSTRRKAAAKPSKAAASEAPPAEATAAAPPAAAAAPAPPVHVGPEGLPSLDVLLAKSVVRTRALFSMNDPLMLSENSASEVYAELHRS